MNIKRILIIVNLVLLAIAAPLAAMKYLGPWAYKGNEVLIAGRDDPERGEKIEVFCHYQDSKKGLFNKRYKGHAHWAFMTIDENKNGRFDDDPREELIGFDKKSEVAIESYRGDDEIHIHCNDGDLTHWLIVNAGAGDDKVFGGGTREWIYGGTGVDILFGHCDEDCESQRTCLAEGSTPSVKAGTSRLPKRVPKRRDLIVAGSDDDDDEQWAERDLRKKRKAARGDRQEEIYCGDNERCAVLGSKGRDCIRGATHGVTMLHAQSEDDDIVTYGGDDIVHGGSGDDTIKLGAGNDQAYGGRGEDKIYGDEGDDRLNGGPLADLLAGGPGDDHLCGIKGGDTLIGGEGNDRGYEYEDSTYEGIEKLDSSPCFPRAEEDQEKRVLQAPSLRAFQFGDWLGLPQIRVVGTRAIPRGFTTAEQFEQAVTELKDILSRREIRDTRIIIFGQAVEGFYYPGKPFLYRGPDATAILLNIESPQMMDALKEHWFMDKRGLVQWSWVAHEYPELEIWTKKWKQILKREILAQLVLPEEVYIGPTIVVE